MRRKSFKAEHQKQDEVIARLNVDYTFPLFSAKFAIESARRTAYRDTASASMEIVDNSLEAGASFVHVTFDRAESKVKGKKKESVSQIAFIDDGSGMSSRMLRFALSWGGGIHHDNPEFIGKFGFGLPNSSVNQTRLTKVYSRRSADEEWMEGTLDIDNVASDGTASIPEPVSGKLPLFVQEYLARNDLSLDHGTVVVWIKPDRLTYQIASNLREHLLDRFGTVYRYLLDTEVKVEGKKVEIVDPLFLSPEGRYYRPPEEGGAQPGIDREFAVKFFRDPETNEPRLEKIQMDEQLPKAGDTGVALGTIRVRTAWFPLGFAVGGGRAWIQPIDEHVSKRMQIRIQGNRGISFVRSGREIQTLDAFPRTARDRASGLGDWPLLQSYAYHYGMEVWMGPELDEAFGITNDKQGVRPIPDFWKLLTTEEIDRHLRQLDAAHREARTDAKRAFHAKQLEQSSENPTPAEQAVAAADRALGRKPQVPDHQFDRVKEKEEEEAKKLVEQEGKPVTPEAIEMAKVAMKKDAEFRPYKVEYEHRLDGPFYRPEWRTSDQKVVWINKAHPFYHTLYLSVVNEGGGAARQAIDALLLCLAKAELTADDQEMQLFYETQRTQVWSRDIEVVMKSLASKMSDTSDEEPEEAPAVSEEKAEAA